ncbi:MAG: hypothetical protein NVSMB64_18320 [Candidatus Velthaea sp.]
MTDSGMAATVLREQNGSQDIFLFARGRDDRLIYVNSRNTNTAKWSGWRLVPGGLTVYEPVAATSFGSNMWAFAVKPGAVYAGSIMSNRFSIPSRAAIASGASIDNAWSGWTQVAGTETTVHSPAAAVRNVFMVTGGKVYVQSF